MKSHVKELLPQKGLKYMKSWRQSFINTKRRRLCALGEVTFRDILTNDLGLAQGDVVFIQSSLRNLSVAFPFSRLWQIIQDVVGPDGTLLFPTYPRLPSYTYLTSGEGFDVRNTPSYTGFLTEFARQQPNAIRKGFSEASPAPRPLPPLSISPEPTAELPQPSINGTPTPGY